MKSFFLNTPFGSWLKMFLAAALSQYLIVLTDPNQTVLSWQTLQNIGIAGGVVVLPVIINWLNKADPRYGKNKTTEVVEKDI